MDRARPRRRRHGCPAHSAVVDLDGDGKLDVVADVQPGDLDGDGDMDLAVAEFGYDHGRVLWLENRGGGKFRDHVLLTAPGCIHVPLADFDGDGDLEWQRMMDVYHGMGLAQEWRVCHELISAGKVAEAEPRLRHALQQEWEPAGVDLIAEIELQRGRSDEAVRLEEAVREECGKREGNKFEPGSAKGPSPGPRCTS